MSSYLRGLLLSTCVALVACGEVRREPAGTDQPDPSDDDGSRADGGGGEAPDAGAGDGEPDAREPGEIDAGTPVSPTTPGDIIVTEIHKDPVAVPDEVGEWFEIHNPTELTFDLSELIVTDTSEPRRDFFAFPPDIILPPRGTMLLAADDDPARNGGTEPDVVWAVSTIVFGLGNEADEIILLNPNGPTGEVELDRVAYDETFPGTAGRSMSLDPALYDAVSNDAAASWCDATVQYGDGDFGTPASLNPECP